MNDIATAAKALNPQITEWYKALHQIPELEHDLPKTEKFITDELTKLGLPWQKKYGIVATLKGELPGPTLALRADTDALPITETADVPFAAKGDAMHACGHDAHAAMMLGVAKLLTERKAQLKGEVRFIFQPAEENLEGAKAMIAEGVLDGVDCIVGMHTSTLLFDAKKTGVIGCRVGSTMASSLEMRVVFKGKGTHGAAPHLGVDPIVMACEAVGRLQKIISREISPLDSAIVTVGAIHGGSLCNIIPDTCEIRTTIRSLTPEMYDFMKKRTAEIVEDTAKSMRGSVEITYPINCLPLVNNEELVSKLRKVVADTLGQDMYEEIKNPMMGGEDFSFYLPHVKGLFFFHSSKFGDKRDYPHHNPNFMLNTEVLWTGTAALTAFALE